MTASCRIVVSEESQIGETRREVVQLCRGQGHDEDFSSTASILATEMARNLILHADGGEMIIRSVPHPLQTGIELLSLDRGPGMRNVAECMRDGHSTGGTAGNGLGSMKRLASKFDLFTQPGRGTAVWVRLCPGKNASAGSRYDWGGVSIADDREKLCGDAWEAIEKDGNLSVMVADGLGHGPFAEEAAREAIAIFRANALLPGEEVLALADRALFKTRGAAAAIITLSPETSRIRICGVGNISMRVTDGDKLKSFLCDNGTLGTNVRRITQHSIPLGPGALLIMHSDGLFSNWDFAAYPGLLNRHPALIAGVLYRDFKRGGDDATVVVARHVL